MYGPKSFGAWYLHCTTPTAPLDTLVLFSSVGSGLGNVGQGNYAAGNACLDTYALSQRHQGLAACSLQWPLVGGAGMGAAAFAASAERTIVGMAGISLEQYASCLAPQLSAGVCGGLCVQMVHRSDVRELLQDLADRSQPRFNELTATAKAVAVAKPAAAAAISALNDDSTLAQTGADNRPKAASTAQKVLSP